MRLGIMQPYFFPSIRYFSLMHITDSWVFFDTPQFVRHSWMNRNRILKPEAGWQYIIVPLAHHHQKTPLNQIVIDHSRNWQQTILSQLGHYKRVAPNYRQVMDFLGKLFSGNYELLSEFNIASLKNTCEYLGITLHGTVYSEMNIEIDQVEKPDEWALYICKSMGFSQYINALNGIQFFDRDKFESHEITIQFLSYTNLPYEQGRNGFEPDLSILDLMMFLDPPEIRSMLDSYELI